MTDNIDIILDNDREWRKLLLDRQDILFNKIDKLSDCLSEEQKRVEHRITKIEVKSGFIGFIGGVCAYLGSLLFK
jgi:hypothetical protein